MVIVRMTVKSHLEQFLTQEDPEQIEWLTDICWLMFLVHQFAFQIERRKNNAARAIFMKRIRSDETRALHFTYEPMFPREQPPGDEDFEQAVKLYKELVQRCGRAKLFRILTNECWEAGMRQRQQFQRKKENLTFSEGEIVSAPALAILSYDIYADLRYPPVEATLV